MNLDAPQPLPNRGLKWEDINIVNGIYVYQVLLFCDFWRRACFGQKLA